VMFFIMIFIILVASFSIAVTLSVSVLRKTREIGLLCSIGARQWQIAQTFCLQSVAIGVIGVVLGISGALLALINRNAVVGFLLSIFNAQDAFYQLYGFEGIPVSYSVRDFVLVSAFTLILTTFAGLVPAIRAAKLKPSEALRSE
jgi:lipoprotein-releasing system permease protein